MCFVTRTDKSRMAQFGKKTTKTLLCTTIKNPGKFRKNLNLIQYCTRANKIKSINISYVMQCMAKSINISYVMQ